LNNRKVNINNVRVSGKGSTGYLYHNEESNNGDNDFNINGVIINDIELIVDKDTKLFGWNNKGSYAISK